MDAQPPQGPPLGPPPMPEPQHPAGMPQYPAQTPPYPAYPAPSTYTYVQLPPGPAPGLKYAGFWIRFLAAVIDGIILDIPLLFVYIAFVGNAFSSYVTCVSDATASGTLAGAACSSQLSSFVTSLYVPELAGLVFGVLYFVILWSRFGATLGQRMLGLHVVDAATGRHIGIGRSVGRYIGYLVSSFVLAIGLIWAAFDPRKQGWHDKMASTFVVRKV